jgi:hypothetical protein
MKMRSNLMVCLEIARGFQLAGEALGVEDELQVQYSLGSVISYSRSIFSRIYPSDDATLVYAVSNDSTTLHNCHVGDCMCGGVKGFFIG